MNINFRTRAHKDVQDFGLCIAMPFGEWEGGDLVLYELGLVLDLRQGSLCVFKSSIVTHFNLDFTGKRFAIILHTDDKIATAEQCYEQWANNANFIPSRAEGPSA